ncbi:neurofilament medium polypeptide-like [Hetaerina americana]|uniref:neurofilament medium polypeptide-like n=1 Tax=Hetaerina americana TaxID=62018 RepID=UPI003A7F348E
MRTDNEDSSAETRARVKEMLANGILKEVEGQDTKRVKIEPGVTNNASGQGKPSKEGKTQPTAASGPAVVKSGKQSNKGSASAVKVEAVAEEEEIDSANGSRPASAETRTEEHSVSEKGADASKAEALLKVPEREEDDPSTSENDKASVENVGKGEAGNVTDEEGGELEDDEDSGVEGSGGRGEEGNEAGTTSPPPQHAPAVAGRVLLETEIQFSEATAITMTILEEADVASKDGDPGRIHGRCRGGGGRRALVDEEFDPDVAIRVLDSSEEEGMGKIREVGRASAGRRVRFGGEMVLQTPDSSAETPDVPKKKEDESMTNSSEDQEASPNQKQSKATENQSMKQTGSGPFVSHIPVRVDPSKRQQKTGGDGGGEQGKSKHGNPAPPPPSAPEPPAAEDEAEVAEEVATVGSVVEVEREGTRVEVTTEDSAQVKLEAEGTEVELVVKVVGGGEGAQNAAVPEMKQELPIVLPMSSSRVHSWEDLGIVDKQILVDIRNKVGEVIVGECSAYPWFILSAFLMLAKTY